MSTEAQRAYHRAYYRKNRERWITKYARSREEDRGYKRVQKLVQRGADEGTTADTVRILSHDPCAYCGGASGSIDHIDASGSSSWENLTAACRVCNATKGKDPLLKHLLAVRLRRDRDLLNAQLRLVSLRRGNHPKGTK